MTFLSVPQFKLVNKIISDARRMGMSETSLYQLREKLEVQILAAELRRLAPDMRVLEAAERVNRVCGPRPEVNPQAASTEVKTESTAARILRELSARPMTRRELAELMGLSASAISIQVAKLQALRAVVVAGNVRSPSGVGVVLAFRATPDAAAIFDAHEHAPAAPRPTPERLELLALLADRPASVTRVAHLTGKSERNARKGLVHMEDHGLVERQSVPGLASAQFRLTPAGRAMLGEIHLA